MKHKTLHAVIICVIILLMVFFSFFTTPYVYECDPMLKQVSLDKLLVLKLVWILIFMTNIVCSFVVKSRKKIFFTIYLILSLLSLVKLLSLYFIK